MNYEIRDSYDKIRRATGRFKTVQNDRRTLDRIINRYNLGLAYIANLDDAKREAAAVVTHTIRQLVDTGFNHDTEILTAILEARASDCQKGRLNGHD